MKSPRWKPVETPPRRDEAVIVRYTDGSTDYVLWTGERFFPFDPKRSPRDWIAVEALGAELGAA